MTTFTNLSEVADFLRDLRVFLKADGNLPNTVKKLDNAIDYLRDTSRPADADDYTGPNLHELLTEIILKAEGPISIGDLSVALFTHADPALFHALAADGELWRSDGRPELFADEPNPDYITRYIAEGEQPSPTQEAYDDQPPKRPAYNGPTLHAHLDEIILGAEGPISIGEVIYKLLMNSEPELFFALGQELQYIRANSDIIPTLVEENPDYITRYSPNTGDGTVNTSAVDDNDDDDALIEIAAGKALFDIAKDIIAEKKGSILLSELVTGIFERSTPELFDELADERAVWEYEDRPEIVWLDEGDDLLLETANNQPEESDADTDALENIPFDLLVKLHDTYGKGIRTAAGLHPNPLVQEALLSVSAAIEATTEVLLDNTERLFGKKV